MKKAICIFFFSVKIAALLVGSYAQRPYTVIRDGPEADGLEDTIKKANHSLN